jgi:hypothetical protein
MSEETVTPDVIDITAQLPKAEPQPEVDETIVAEPLDGTIPETEMVPVEGMVFDVKKVEDQAGAVPVVPADAPRKVLLKEKATVTYTGVDGTQHVEECWRSRPDLIRFIAALAEDGKVTDEGHVHVEIGYEEGSDKLRNKDGEDVDVVLADGTPFVAIRQLVENSMIPMQAVSKLQNLCAELTDRSSLKCILLTFVFDDAKAYGVGMLSSATDVTDADLLALGEAAVQQAQQFKDETRKMRPSLVFPSDNNGLVLPGRFGGKR